MILKIYPLQAFSPICALAPGAAARFLVAHPTLGLMAVDVNDSNAPTAADVELVVGALDKAAEFGKAFDADPSTPANVDIWKVIKAKAISDEAFRLGVAPGALTGPQLASLRNRIAAIYAAL